MRHRKKINHLGRTSSHRQATLANMASSLIIHKRISTTLAKAKALKVYVEPLITKSKVDSTHSRRTVFSYLGNKNAVSELFREISQKIADRPGGYTRILKTGFRKGDGAEMCFIELVDYNLNMLKSAEESQQKKTRRGKAKKKDEDATAPVKKDKVVEKTESEEVVEEPKAEVTADESPVVEAETATENEEKKDEEEKASE